MKKFRWNGKTYKWTMTPWQAAALIMLLVAGVWANMSLMASLPIE